MNAFIHSWKYCTAKSGVGHKTTCIHLKIQFSLVQALQLLDPRRCLSPDQFPIFNQSYFQGRESPKILCNVIHHFLSNRAHFVSFSLFPTLYIALFSVERQGQEDLSQPFSTVQIYFCYRCSQFLCTCVMNRIFGLLKCICSLCIELYVLHAITVLTFTFQGSTGPKPLQII